MLPALDDLKLAATLSSGESLAVLRVGTVNAGFAGALIRRLRGTFPEADFTTRAQSCATPLIELVAEGRLEVAVVGDCPGYEIAPDPE